MNPKIVINFHWGTGQKFNVNYMFESCAQSFAAGLIDIGW